MSSDTPTARNETVEEGIHSLPTSQNTTDTTDDDVPPSTTSWWNQKSNKIYISVTVMTVSIALSVGVFVSSRGNKTAKQANPLKASEGHDTAITAELSTSNHRNIGSCNIIQSLYAPQPDSSSAKIAVDGKNLVVVSRGARQYGFDPHLDGEHVNPMYVESDEFNVYVEFYSLQDHNWKKVKGFQEEDIDDFKWEHGQRSVALSGNTAVVIFPSDSAFAFPVYTYTQNNSGSWEKVSTGLPEDAGVCLRQTVDVDNGLMATFDDVKCGYCYKSNKAFVYKRTSGTWKEAGEIIISDVHNENGDVYQVALSGDTLAVQVTGWHDFDLALASGCHINIYQYDQGSGSISLQQDRFGSGCSPMVFDGKYLVHGLSVYHRQGIGQPFSLQKTFNSADYGNGFGKSLALDNGILVVGSDNRTYMFSLQNDAIAEVFSLDQNPDDTHEISDGTMVTSNQNEFGVTIVDCTQSVPAQTSSPTEAPTPRLSASTTESTTTTDDVCLTEADCKDQMNARHDQFVSGNYPFYGCVSKGGNLYWGAGGTVEQMTSNFPPGSVKERVFC
jgi:hypothetical protein